MAIDNMQGKVSTTGTMDQSPSVPAAPNLNQLGTAQPMPEPQQPAPAEVGTTNPLQQEFPDASPMELEFAERAKSLTDEDQAALQTVLSPSVKNALAKIIPEFKPVMDAYGTNEPNVVIPMSLMSNYAMKVYGNNNPEEAVARFYDDVTSDIDRQMDQNNVPPSQGLMTSPQTT